jgi:hypothetical protein
MVIIPFEFGRTSCFHRHIVEKHGLSLSEKENEQTNWHISLGENFQHVIKRIHVPFSLATTAKIPMTRAAWRTRITNSVLPFIWLCYLYL